MYRSHIGPQHAPHKAASTADIDAVVDVVWTTAAAPAITAAPAADIAVDSDDDDVVWHFISMGTKTDDTKTFCVM